VNGQAADTAPALAIPKGARARFGPPRAAGRLAVDALRADAPKRVRRRVIGLIERILRGAAAWPRNGDLSCLVALLPILALLGCAASGEPPPKPPTRVIHLPVTRVDFLALPDAQMPALDVRALTLEELKNERSSEALVGATMEVGTIGVGLFEGLVLGAAGAGSVVAGGIFILPFAVVVGAIDDTNHAAVASAIAEADFPARLERAIAARFARSTLAPPAPGPARYVLEARIAGFGFAVPETMFETCFAADVRYRLREDARTIAEGAVVWSAWQRSEDVPPPDCALLDDFAADAAARARRTLVEAPEVLAAVIVRRLGVGP